MDAGRYGGMLPGVHRGRIVFAGVLSAGIIAACASAPRSTNGADAGADAAQRRDLDASEPLVTVDALADADAGPDAPCVVSADGGATPTSCAVPGDGLTNCGPNSSDSCCASPLVRGGTYSRSYDGITEDLTDPQYRATVSDFRLDKYEVTMGRFRRFVDAFVGGWRPTPGSGKHAHLNCGSGLVGAGGYETGWVAGWTSKLPASRAEWESSVKCVRPIPGLDEKKPVYCITWYEAAAFCLWDGGFLPSEAEWNYAAAGGSEQRVYPWSLPYPPGSTTLTPADAKQSAGLYSDVGSYPAGFGRWAHADLAGNVWEWILDWYHDPYSETECNDCADLTASTYRVTRGGGSSAEWLRAGVRYSSAPAVRTVDGTRCARSP